MIICLLLCVCTNFMYNFKLLNAVGNKIKHKCFGILCIQATNLKTTWICQQKITFILIDQVCFLCYQSVTVFFICLRFTFSLLTAYKSCRAIVSYALKVSENLSSNSVCRNSDIMNINHLIFVEQSRTINRFTKYYLDLQESLIWIFVLFWFTFFHYGKYGDTN